ncbi:MAG: CsbD family protein [Proteobacteria bacterium]|nr:CsbD family protein [Pseudomonadota bacterium]
MNKDQAKGRAEELSGKTKATLGKVLKDGKLIDKGRMEEVAGKARATYGDAKDELDKDADEQ